MWVPPRNIRSFTICPDQICFLKGHSDIYCPIITTLIFLSGKERMFSFQDELRLDWTSNFFKKKRVKRADFIFWQAHWGPGPLDKYFHGENRLESFRWSGLGRAMWIALLRIWKWPMIMASPPSELPSVRKNHSPNSSIELGWANLDCWKTHNRWRQNPLWTKLPNSHSHLSHSGVEPGPNKLSL